MAERLEDAVERLYGLPLEEFTQARNALAKRVPKEERERVKALRKPTVAVWAVNQLARRERGGVNALLRAGARVRETQAAALAGKGPERMRDAVGSQRHAVQELVDVARRRLGVSEQQLDRVAATLQAASTDEESRELLKAGTLTEEVEASGFEALAGMPVAPRKQRPKAAKQRSKRAAAKPKGDRERERKLREARADVKRLERELERARKRLGRLTED